MRFGIARAYRHAMATRKERAGSMSDLHALIRRELAAAVPGIVKETVAAMNRGSVTAPPHARGSNPGFARGTSDVDDEALDALEPDPVVMGRMEGRLSRSALRAEIRKLIVQCPMYRDEIAKELDMTSEPDRRAVANQLVYMMRQGEPIVRIGNPQRHAWWLVGKVSSDKYGLILHDEEFVAFLKTHHRSGWKKG